MKWWVSIECDYNKEEKGEAFLDFGWVFHPSSLL
jgi:hypothetical protein